MMASTHCTVTAKACASPPWPAPIEVDGEPLHWPPRPDQGCHDAAGDDVGDDVGGGSEGRSFIGTFNRGVAGNPWRISASPCRTRCATSGCSADTTTGVTK